MSGETTVESPDNEYSVRVSEVWDVADVPADARDLSDTVIMQNIREAMLVVEDVAGPNARPEDKKTVVLSRAGQYTLDDNETELMSSMSALDVSIDFDVQAQRERLESRADRLLEAIKQDGQFVFRSL